LETPKIITHTHGRDQYSPKSSINPTRNAIGWTYKIPIDQFKSIIHIEISRNYLEDLLRNYKKFPTGIARLCSPEIGSGLTGIRPSGHRRRRFCSGRWVWSLFTGHLPLSDSLSHSPSLSLQVSPSPLVSLCFSLPQLSSLSLNLSFCTETEKKRARNKKKEKEEGKEEERNEEAQYFDIRLLSF
jgi:hypothetical protein